MIFFHTSSELEPVTMLVAEIAPGLTSGFISGAPVPTTVCTPSTAMIELNRAPVASTPIRFSIDVEPLLLDDLRHREDLGDRLDRDLGLDVAGGVDLAVGGDHARCRTGSGRPWPAPGCSRRSCLPSASLNFAYAASTAFCTSAGACASSGGRGSASSADRARDGERNRFVVAS